MSETLRLLAAYPQLFVGDVTQAAAFYRDKLGFNVTYLRGKPPFFGLVERDSAGLNLRRVQRPAIDPALREQENLLSANIPVRAIKKLFIEFKGRGVAFHTTLRAHPWGPAEFIVRDPAGNLICFNGDVGSEP